MADEKQAAHRGRSRDELKMEMLTAGLFLGFG
jgi:hypothetical protein